MRVSQFSTSLQVLAPARCVEVRFSLANATGRYGMSVSRACAALHALTNSRTHAHTYAGSEMPASDFYINFRLGSKLCTLTFCALGNRISQALSSTKVINWCRVIVILNRPQLLQFDWRFASFDLRQVYWLECEPLVSSDACGIAMRFPQFSF